MNPIRYTVLFLPHKKNAEDREAHLICRVKWNGSRSIVSLNLGFVIDPEKWEPKTQMCALRSTHGKLKIPAQTINAEIKAYRDAAREVFDAFSASDVWPSTDEVRNALKARLGLDVPKLRSTEEVYRRFMQEESIERSWTNDTRTKMRTTGGHMLSFQPFSAMEGFTARNLALYIEHLRRRGLSDSTIKRHLANVKWFLNWAHKHKHLKSDEYRLFRPKLNVVAPPIIFLTWEELQKVWNYETEDFALRQTVDFFLFCCFTSLRWSDCHNLKWSDVGTDCIKIVTIKTVEPLTIQFNKWSEAVISRYIDVAFPDDHVFCRTANQVMNRQLKRVMRELEIDDRITVVSYKDGQRVEEVKAKWELVGTHTGRKTFICNSLIMGIPPTVVMKWTGHADYDAMKPYIAVAESSMAREMARFDDRFVTPEDDPM